MVNAARVSVLIPAYNAERFLAQALDSLKAQTLDSWEALIVDDGSQDGTAALALNYAAEDQRFRLIEQANAGCSAARNTALAQSQGELVAFLDSDDFWDPHYLQAQVDLLESQQVDFVYSAPTFVDEAGQMRYCPDWSLYAGQRSGPEFFALQYSAQFLLPSSIVVRSEVLRRSGGFDPSLRSGEDCEMWLRLARQGCSFAGSDRKLVFYRTHSGGLSRQAEQGFWCHMSFLPQYYHAPELSERHRPRPFRIVFRNMFTYLGFAGRAAAKPMFDAYSPYDPKGGARWLMTILRHILPSALFWLVSRYFVIPLAWHVERLHERVRGDRV